MTAPADDLFLRLQTALAGEYSIERELGRGGMGIVYLAREVRLAREVAIKVLTPALAADPARRAQFVREAQMAAGLSHPNIAPIHRVDLLQIRLRQFKLGPRIPHLKPLLRRISPMVALTSAGSASRRANVAPVTTSLSPRSEPR